MKDHEVISSSKVIWTWSENLPEMIRIQKCDFGLSQQNISSSSILYTRTMARVRMGTRNNRSHGFSFSCSAKLKNIDNFAPTMENYVMNALTPLCMHPSTPMMSSSKRGNDLIPPVYYDVMSTPWHPLHPYACALFVNHPSYITVSAHPHMQDKFLVLKMFEKLATGPHDTPILWYSRLVPLLCKVAIKSSYDCM